MTLDSAVGMVVAATPETVLDAETPGLVPDGTSEAPVGGVESEEAVAVAIGASGVALDFTASVLTGAAEELAA